MGRKDVYTKENLLSDSEVESIKRVINNPIEHTIIITLLYSGLRIGELIHFRREWIDWASEVIRVPARQLCSCYECRKERKTHREPGYWYPKTKQGERTIPLSPNTFPELSAVLREYFKPHKCLGEIARNRGHVWTSLQDVAERAQLTHKLFPHVFRGTYARLLARHGISAITMTKVMGWKSIEVAMWYINLEANEVKLEYRDKLTDYGASRVPRKVPDGGWVGKLKKLFRRPK